MNIERIGIFKAHEDIDEWLISEPLMIKPLPDKPYRFVIDYYDDAILNILTGAMESFKNMEPETFKISTPFIYQFYKDSERLLTKQEIQSLGIVSPKDVWGHIKPNEEIHVAIEDRSCPFAFISIEFECEWEIEHGLQMVFREGITLCKISSCDGHLTNEHAYDREEFRDKIYVSISGL